MLCCGMQTGTAAGAYIDELETFKQRYQQLEIRNQELENNNLTLKNNVIEFQNKYLEIKERYDLLIFKRFARSAEQLQLDDKQQALFVEEAAATETAVEEQEEELSEVKSYQRKKGGRKAIDPSIPRVERIIDIPESEKQCACGAVLKRIGEETNEKLHIIPQEIHVVKTIRPKYACPCCEGVEEEGIKPTVKIMPVEPSIIPRGIASPSLLATIMIQKYEDHLPYNRQEIQFERIGVIISRQDMCNWQQHAYTNVKPLFDLLDETLKAGPILQMDETTVQVMGEEGRSDLDKSWMWLRRGGPPGKTVILYEYRQTRAAYHAKELLKGYSGFLQTDGYEAYNAAIKDMPGIIHVGCFAHARRYFFEASKASKKPQSAEEGIKFIRKLYYIENEMRAQFTNEEDFVNERKKHAQPVLNDFKKWLLKRAEEVPPTLLLGKAVSYSLSQWDKMVMYLESYHLTPDNNACENAIRPFVLGRKNWLFNKSPKGAESSCGMFSLIQTAKQNGLIPWQYLKALFEKAPYAVSTEDWQNLLPWNIFIP